MKELFFNGDPKGRKKHMDQFLASHRATGLDWAEVEVRLIEELQIARDRTNRIIASKDLRIAELENQLAEKDKTIIDLESHIEALKIAWKHRNEGV